MANRKIVSIIPGRRTQDGAGVRMTRVLSIRETKMFDPFLMLDWFDSHNPDDYTAGFPWHPHRGIETVTFLFHGSIEHGDSMGNKGVITDGDCQWMTAGSGIIHQEMPLANPHMQGLQLWVNLSADEKMCAPRYRDIKAAEVPQVETDGAVVRVIAGSYGGVSGPTEGVSIKPMFLDVSLKTDATITIDTPADETVFLFLVSGAMHVLEDETEIAFSEPAMNGIADTRNDEAITANAAYLLNSGDAVQVQAAGDCAHFLLFAGKPLHQHIAWGGPIVMNTQEELQQAFSELDEGTFVK